MSTSPANPDSPPSDARPPRRRRRWGRIIRFWCRSLLNAAQLEWFPGRRLFRRIPRADVIADSRAGLNVALLAVPQSIAFSLIAGLPPIHGLISSAVGAVTGPFFSGSRYIVFGPTNATSVLLLTGLAATGLSVVERIAVLPLFVLMVGFFLVLGALARASFLINYISRSVITGYICAAALFIMVNQLQNALGFEVEHAGNFLAMVIEIGRHLPETRFPELGMAVVALACNVALVRWAPRAPSVALTLVVTGTLGVSFEWLGWHLTYLSHFSLGELSAFRASFDFNHLGELAAPALALAFVSVLEGTSIGKTIASHSGERINVNQEMYAMGVANGITAVCGGMNVSGSLTRSMVSDASGARTPWANIISGGIILVLLVVLGYLIQFIPRAALAAIVMSIAFSLFNQRNLLLALRTTRSDAIVFCVTCFAALLFTIESAIYLGAFTSIMLFLRKVGTPDLVEYNFTDQGQLAAMPTSERRNVPGISILHAEGDLFFGSSDIFAQQIREVTRDPSLKVIILRLKNARHLDATAAVAIEELLNFLRRTDRHLIVSGADREIARVFANSGLLAKLGSENFFRQDPINPTVSTRDALRRANQLLGRRDAEIRIFVDQTRHRKNDEGDEDE